MDMTLFEEATEVKGGPDLSGVTFLGLKSAAAAMLNEILEKNRIEKCGPCQMPETKDEHVCGKSIVASAPTDEKWIVAKEEVKHRKSVEAFLLEYNHVSCKQVLSLPVMQFSQDIREELRSIMIQ